MEIRHLEQFRLWVFQPLGSCESWHLGQLGDDMSRRRRADARIRRMAQRDRRARRCGR